MASIFVNASVEIMSSFGTSVVEGGTGTGGNLIECSALKSYADSLYTWTTLEVVPVSGQLSDFSSGSGPYRGESISTVFPGESTSAR